MRQATAACEPRLGDDARLIGKLLGGDEDAFLSLVRREHASMIRYAGLLVSIQGVEEEVVREAWRRILTGLARYDGRDSLRSWMFGVVADCARSRGDSVLRSARAAALDEDAEQDAVKADRFFPPASPNAGEWKKPPKPWPQDWAWRPKTFELLRESIDRLPWLGRQVVFLRDVEGWSAWEVSALLGITERRQRVLLHRARSRMRTELEHHLVA
jgi:RNA polymerase sigma-70 factor, ECF subfamily